MEKTIGKALHACAGDWRRSGLTACSLKTTVPHAQTDRRYRETASALLIEVIASQWSKWETLPFRPVASRNARS